MLADNFQVFAEADINYYFDEGILTKHSLISISGKAFFSYFPNSKITFYAMAEHTPTLEGPWGKNNYSQAGVGGKYLITPHFEIETLFAKFIAGKNNGAGQSINLGLRLIY